MFVRNRWSDLGFVLAVLNCLATADIARAASDPEAIRCVEDFLSHYRNVQEYRTTLFKREFDLKGKTLHEEKIALTFKKDDEKPGQVTFEYLNQGTTGIRNNGMTVKYREGEQVELKLGKAKGLGAVVNGVASLAVNDRMSLFDPQMLQDEVFTLNRAGFDFLAFALRKHLPTLKTASKGGIRKVGDGCALKYEPHLDGEETVVLQPGQSIREIEERYVTLAYLIYQNNRDQFKSFQEVFTRTKPVTVKIPRGFMEFDLTLQESTKLPDEFNLFFRGKQIGAYGFGDTKVRTKADGG